MTIYKHLVPVVLSALLLLNGSCITTSRQHSGWLPGSRIDDNGLRETALYGKLNFMRILALNHVAGETVTMEILKQYEIPAAANF